MKYSKLSFLFVAVLLSACSSSQYTTTRVEVEGMRNSVEVGSDLLIGGQPSEEALETLSRKGYSTVLSTREASEVEWDEEAHVNSLGMNFVRVPIPNPVSGITDEQVELFDQAMSAQDGPIVLHCGSGNRVAGLWAVWLVEKKGLPVEEALEIATRSGMKSMRTHVEKRLGIKPSM